MAKKEYLFREGSSKLKHDLDIVNLLEMKKVVRVMRRVLFNQN